MTDGTEDIPEDLEPGYAPDPRSFRQILFGILLIATSPLLWEVGVAMDPAVVDVWRQLVPVAPFGQFFPSIFPSQLAEGLDTISFKHYPGDKSISSPAVLLSFLAPVSCGIGLLFVALGAVWTAAESLRSARDS